MPEYLKKLSVLLLLVAFSRTEVTVKDGGYSALVSFTQNIQPEEGKVLLENLKESLNDASNVLYNAIGLQFSEVIVKIPSTWSTSEWNVPEISAATKNIKPDFLIDGTSDVVFGKFPHAHQYASCGVPGHQIVVPSVFLSENDTFPKGTILAREWLKYRYGVFDENGFSKDPLYPLYYVVPGGDLNEVKITDCTNVPVTYDFVDKSEGKDCSELKTTVFQNLNADLCDIRPHNGSLENVTSSIMYYQKDFEEVQHICGKDPDHHHNSRSPNKQNALCFGQSVWEVVKKSPDLKTENTAKFAEIQFTYVQEAKPKLVIAWENTAEMKKKKVVIANAVMQTMIDLPDGSQFVGFPFDDESQTAIDPLLVLDGLQAKANVQLNMHFDFVKPGDGDINLAIDQALNVLRNAAGDAPVEGTIIIIARSGATLKEELVQSLKESQICIMLMFLSENAIPEELTSAFATLPCGTVKEISLENDKDVETFENLYNGMRIFLPSIVDDKESKMLKTEYLSMKSPINVEVDDSMETVTFWVYSKKPSKFFNLKFNDQVKNKDTVDIGEVKRISYPISQAGKIEFSYLYEDEPILTQVRTTYKAGKYFSGEVIILDTTEEGASEQMPVIIYAFLSYGAYPVQNAKVSATVVRPDGENITMDLNDDGVGDPDITQNDGIYSRYFTSFNDKGNYIVTVTVKNNGDLTSYGADENAGYKTCCGSYVNGETPKLKEFSKEFVTTFTTISERPNIGYKPSRIVDLRISEVDDDKITLKWTAPGEEADHGTAKSYEIKNFTDQDEVNKNFDSGTEIEYTKNPQERGETETFEIKFSDFKNNGSYYIAMRTKNDNHTSDISNIIELLVSEDTENPDGGKDEKEKDKTKKSTTSSRTVGIVIGVILAVIVLIILIYLAIYYLVLKSKRKAGKEQKERNEAPTARDSNKRDDNARDSNARDSNAMNSITFIPASKLIEHHNEKTRAKLENKEPPILKEEDFEVKKSPPTNEAGENSGYNNPAMDKFGRNGQPNLPPKSPKRTTPV